MFLKGIRVLDFSQYIPGPFASLRLADFGADIIKIEPISGELARARMGPEREQGLVFEANNPNKKSITVDLKTKEGTELALKLIEQSDVLIESFRPGVMKRLGLDYKKVKERNEKIIYCSITGYGQEGTRAKLGSHDLNYLSLTGVLSQFEDENGRPVHPTITLADSLGGMAASETIVAALFAREKTGKGAYIDLALIDPLLALMNNHFVTNHRTGLQKGVSVLSGEIVSYQIYETIDDKFISIGALERKFWDNFCHAVNQPRWVEAHFSKAENSNPFYVQIVDCFKSKTQEEWIQFAKEVDCCITPILEVSEVSQLFSSRERTFININDENEIYVTTRYDEDLLEQRVRAPKTGEHTEVLLKQLLFLDEEEIATYKNKKII